MIGYVFPCRIETIILIIVCYWYFIGCKATSQIHSITTFSLRYELVLTFVTSINRIDYRSWWTSSTQIYFHKFTPRRHIQLKKWSISTCRQTNLVPHSGTGYFWYSSLWLVAAVAHVRIRNSNNSNNNGNDNNSNNDSIPQIKLKKLVVVFSIALNMTSQINHTQTQNRFQKFNLCSLTSFWSSGDN